MARIHSGSNTHLAICAHCGLRYPSGQNHHCVSVSDNTVATSNWYTNGYLCGCGRWVLYGGHHTCQASYVYPPYRCSINSPTWTYTTTANGWKCPGCGACFGPSVSACTNCKPTPTESDSWPSSLEFADDEKATDEHADELDPEHEKYPESEAFDGMPEPRYSWASLDRRAREMARATRERLGRRG